MSLTVTSGRLDGQSKATLAFNRIVDTEVSYFIQILKNKLISPKTLRELAGLWRINLAQTLSCPELLGTKQSQVSGSTGAGCRSSFPRSDEGIPGDREKQQQSHYADWGFRLGVDMANFFCKGLDSKYFRLCGSHTPVTFFIFMTLLKM